MKTSTCTNRKIKENENWLKCVYYIKYVNKHPAPRENNFVKVILIF